MITNGQTCLQITQMTSSRHFQLCLFLPPADLEEAKHGTKKWDVRNMQSERLVQTKCVVKA